MGGIESKIKKIDKESRNYNTPDIEVLMERKCSKLCNAANNLDIQRAKATTQMELDRAQYLESSAKTEQR